MPKQKESLTTSQLARFGNAVLYFTTHIEAPNKTKVLRLLYLCEERSVKKYGESFFGVVFHAWKWGPIQRQVWKLLEPDNDEEDQSLAAYVNPVIEEGANSRVSLEPVGIFSPDVFSQQELDILEALANEYRTDEAANAIDLTKKTGSLWFNAVKKEKGLLQKFENGKQSKSHQKINFAELLEDGPVRKKYEEGLDFSFFDGPSGKR